MSRFSRLLILCFSLAGPVLPAESDLLEGSFWGPERDARIQFYREGGHLCGKIVWLAHPGKDDNNPEVGLRDRSLLNLTIIRGFSPAGPDEWADGTVYDPDSGDTYHGKIWFKSGDHNHLYLRGFVGISLFGRTEIFERHRSGM